MRPIRGLGLAFTIVPWVAWAIVVSCIGDSNTSPVRDDPDRWCGEVAAWATDNDLVDFDGTPEETFAAYQSMADRARAAGASFLPALTPPVATGRFDAEGATTRIRST